MKKGRIFANVIYYIFTFAIGLILAFTLPYLLMYYGESVSMIKKSLESGDYEKAFSIVGGYYDSQYVYQTDFEDGGGIVLFASATLTSGFDEEGNELEDYLLHKSYAGFIYGVHSTYNVTAKGDNQAKVVVIDRNGAQHSIDVLDADSDGDDILDTNATCYEYGFIYIDLDQDTCVSLAKISILDVKGNVFKEVELSFDYGEQFFTDVTPFVEEYNRDCKSENLERLDEELLAKSENYCISSNAVIQSSADKKAAIIVVVYFVFIYLLGDSLIGGRYVIKFFRWVLEKVFKVKFKSRKPINKETFGHDYFCKVTMQADVSAIDDFDESVQVRYSKEDGEICFVLLKNSGYSNTQSIKAGEYLNLWVDLDNNYKVVNLPETLEVEGYQKQFIFKIIKRED